MEHPDPAPDDGQRNCPKDVEFYSKNKFEKLVHLVGFIIRIRTERMLEGALEIGQGPLFGRPITAVSLNFFENAFLHQLGSYQFSGKRLNHERTYFFFSSWLLP